MKADKSEKERQELYDKILKVEQKEDEFLDLKKKFENSIEAFAADFQGLNDRLNISLESQTNGEVSTLSRIFEENQYLSQKMRLYVNTQLEDLSQLSRRIRKNLEEEREELIAERNSLPWE